MIIYIDADSCAVKELALELTTHYSDVKVIAVASTAHQMPDKFETIVCESIDQAVDQEILKLVVEGDIVITHDYDFASLLLDKNVKVIHSAGWVYTRSNIIAKFAQRDFSRLMRQHGYKKKKMTKRAKNQRKNSHKKNFKKAFVKLLEER